LNVRLALPALVLIGAVGGPLAAQQPDQARAEALAKRASDRLDILQREADRLASEERTLLGDLRRLELDREIKSQRLRRAQDESAAVAADLARNAERIEQLQRQDAAVRPELRARLVEMYKLGQGRYLRLLLSSNTREMARAARMVAALAKLDRDRIASHQRLLEDLNSTRAALQDRSRRLEALRVEADRARISADRAAQARNDLIRDIDSRRDLNAQLSAELQQAEQKLQAILRGLSAGAAAPPEPPSLPLAPFRGDLDWPVSGQILRRFARSTETRSGPSNGIEVGAAAGAAVTAVHDGTVAFADAFSGFGNLVIVDHGGRSFSLYGDLLDLAVAKGAHVDRGQLLGTVGSAPTSPPRLYFELRVDGQSVDPLQWLKKR
jgi:septal ring factor EnvC (AmiA/AmiB activator)